MMMSSGDELFTMGLETNTEALIEQLSEVESYSISTSLESSPTTIPSTPGRKESPVLEGTTAGAFRHLTFLQAEQSVPLLRRNDHAITRTLAPCKETLTGSNVHQRAENLPPKGLSLGASNLKAHDEGIMEILCEVKKTNKQLLEYGERLGSLERRMDTMEQSISRGTPSSSCSDTIKTK